MTLTLRYMRTVDIPQVVTIDRLSFDPAWSARSYAYEVNESTYSYMVVLEQTDEKVPTPTTPLRRLMQTFNIKQSLNGRPRMLPEEEPSRIVGYGGLWNIVDEAHISTIATHPDYRGRGWGELLLVGMIRKSIALKAAYVVLEVRVSNTPAQNLYKKYNFEVAGVKAHYYHNNGEDAYDMRLELLNPEFNHHIEVRFAELMAKHHFEDTFSRNPHPHATP